MARSSVVVDQIFACIQGEDNTPRLQDFILSMVFANAAARAKSQAGDGFSVDAFRSGWSAALGNLGWVITAAGTSKMSMSSRGATTTIAQRILTNAPSAAIEMAITALHDVTQEQGPATQSAPISKSHGSSEPSDDDQVQNMWWQSGRKFSPFYASLGAVDLTGDVIRAELVQFTLVLDKLQVKDTGLLHFGSKPLHPKSTAAIFDEVLADSIDLDVSHITAELHPQSFGHNRADLIAKLGGKVFDHFETTPPNLYGDPS